MWLDKLREMKSASGLTTKEISVCSGIPEPTLEKVFAGKTKDPKLETMRQLVYSLGFTLDDLDDNPTKKSPDTTEAASGDDVFRIFDALNTMLVSAGLIQDGEDITEKQSDVLIGICRIIDATFKD